MARKQAMAHLCCTRNTLVGGTMRLSTTAVVVLCLGIVTPVRAGANTLRDIVDGMSKSEVLRVMGSPDAVRLERNGVVCLTYEGHEHGLWSRLFGQRTHLLALKDDRLVDDATIRSENVRAHCSQIAARWDRPMRRPQICGDLGEARC
jgi:hypothetical protein